MTDINYNGQALQDKFVLQVLKNKKNGFFLEIGSADPIHVNNTFILENKYNWKGIMIEYNKKWLNKYKTYRKNSVHIINNAVNIDYKKLFIDNNVPNNIDYLQIDLEANNGSTLNTLKKIDSQVMDNYKFATITFETDVYHTNFLETRKKSREILKRRGYILVFEDVTLFEDWYVHPELVDMKYINLIIEINKKNYENINNSFNYKVYKNMPLITKFINHKNILY